MTIEIKDDMPLPRSRGYNKIREYPFAEMEVGQYIIIPREEGESDSAYARRARQSFRSAQIMRLDATFATRKLKDGSIGVWRVT